MKRNLLVIPAFFFLIGIISANAEPESCRLLKNSFFFKNSNDSLTIPNEPDGNYWKRLSNEQRITFTEGISIGFRAFYTEMFSFPDGENLFRDSNFTKRLAVNLGNDPKNAQEEDSSLLLMMLEMLIKFSPREQQPISIVTESIDRFYDNSENTLIPISNAYKYCVFTMNAKENIVNGLSAERLNNYIERLRQFYKRISDESVK